MSIEEAIYFLNQSLATLNANGIKIKVGTFWRPDEIFVSFPSSIQYKDGRLCWSDNGHEKNIDGATQRKASLESKNG